MLFGVRASGAAFLPTLAEYQALPGHMFPCAADGVWAKALFYARDVCMQFNDIATRYLAQLDALPSSLAVDGTIIFSGPPSGPDRPEPLSEEAIEGIGRALVKVVLGRGEPAPPTRLARSA